MKNIIILIFLLLSYYSQGQVSIGKIDKEKVIKKINEAPPYDSTENFLEYDEFYRYSPYNEIPKNKKPTKQTFYERYLGLQVYYPMFTNNYRTDEVIIFKKQSSIHFLNWEDIGEKYFTIMNISNSFEKSTFYADIKKTKLDISYSLSSALVFELKDKSNDEIVYVVERAYNVKFILLPFYSKVNQIINENIFVAKEYFNGIKVPLSKKYVPVEKDTEWSGELTLLRDSDLKISNEDYREAQDIKYMVILNNRVDTILVYLDRKDYYEHLLGLFVSKDFNEKQKQLIKNTEKQEIIKLNKKYGIKYGKFIYQKTVKIGMSKEMCKAAWGPTLNQRSYTDANGKVEV